MDEVDQKLIKALSHPLRVAILGILEQEVASPIRMAGVLNEPLGNVSYHTKILLMMDFIELVETVPRRGAVEHVYRLKPHSPGSRPWKDLQSALRGHHSGSVLAAFVSRAIEAMDAGTVESREGSGITQLRLKVDEQGWKELRRILASAEDRFLAVAAKSSERVESADDEISVMVAVAAFELAGEDSDPS